MRKLELRDLREIDANLGEFHEVCELHSCGQLIEVSYYDTELNGSSLVGFSVITRTVAEPNDITHVFDHVAQRTTVALNAANTARQEIVTYAQDLSVTDAVFCDTLDEAMAYANSKIMQLARDRSHAA